jgi:hypothetical protein
MAARAYLGPVNETPYTVSDKTVAGGYLPCTFVTEGASTLTQATAFAPMLRLLLNRDYFTESANFFTATNPLLTAYASGDSGIASVLKPGQRYLVAVAAATYTFGQELAVGAAGRVAGAASTNTVVAFALEAGAKSAGDLIEVEIANFYTKA